MSPRSDATQGRSELTDKNIKAAQDGEVLRDRKIPGLHLRVRGAKKGFFLYYRTHAGVERRPKLGDYGLMTLTEAQARAKKMLLVVAAGGDPSKEKQDARAEHTVADLWTTYQKRHVAKKKESSADEDERLWEKNAARALGKLKVSTADYEALADLHDDLTEEKGPITANRTLALLSSMFAFAVAPLGWITRNPCVGVKRNPETKRKRYMTEAEAEAVKAALDKYEAKHPEAVAFLWLLILTGARSGEVASAKWSDIHGNKLVLANHKTDQDGEARVVHLSDAALEVLGKLPKSEHGTLTGIKSPRALWAKIRAEAKCPDLRPHDLRHSFASMGVSAGLTLEQIGELLGHRDSQTTKRYAHLVDEAARTASNSVANLINSRMGVTSPGQTGAAAPSSDPTPS